MTDNIISGMQLEAAQITDFFRQRSLRVRIVGGFAAPTLYVYRVEMAPSQEFAKVSGAMDDLQRIVYWGGGDNPLETMIAEASPDFSACDTVADDVCLIAFTSGTTGEPKGTMHFHRDMLATCDSYGKYVLQASPDDRFIGSAPLAFTFGLGGHVLFPFRIGAASIQLEQATPDVLLPAIGHYKASVCFTAPTAYRAMLGKLGDYDISSLRKCISAGEALPRGTFDAWLDATGIKIMDGIGATEMLHIFISNRLSDMAAATTGRPVTGYEAKIVDEEMNELPRGSVGRLAVRGPTGCRYMADDRQKKYVSKGWNLTGDSFVQDEAGYFHFAARSDDMIISSGYNIAGPEVEAALLSHVHVKECAVIGVPDVDRGQIVEAHVVLVEGVAGDELTRKVLQDHVKATIAPFKYPREIEFTPSLPRTETGKLQRFKLRQA